MQPRPLENADPRRADALGFYGRKGRNNANILTVVVAAVAARIKNESIHLQRVEATCPAAPPDGPYTLSLFRPGTLTWRASNEERWRRRGHINIPIRRRRSSAARVLWPRGASWSALERAGACRWNPGYLSVPTGRAKAREPRQDTYGRPLSRRPITSHNN